MSKFINLGTATAYKDKINNVTVRIDDISAWWESFECGEYCLHVRLRGGGDIVTQFSFRGNYATDAMLKLNRLMKQGNGDEPTQD